MSDSANRGAEWSSDSSGGQGWAFPQFRSFGRGCVTPRAPSAMLRSQKFCSTRLRPRQRRRGGLIPGNFLRFQEPPSPVGPFAAAAVAFQSLSALLPPRNLMK